MVKKPLVILSGPTAVGKTELSIKLAKKINGEIISADSIQIYKKMDIGSAKISESEKENITHYMIDELEPDEEFNIYKFKEMAQKYIDIIYKKNKIPIISGGTGFYIQALLYDIDFTEDESDSEYRKKLLKLSNNEGPEFLHKMLKTVDPESAELIHMNNIKRVIRALEFFEFTGSKISEHNKIQRYRESPYNFSYFVINRDRKTLYDRINKRVDIMLEKGLVEEVINLRNEGYGSSLVSMQGIGYKEIHEYLEGKIPYDEAVEKLKKNSRNFAKRQLTWFRREKELSFIDFEDFNNDSDLVLEKIIEQLTNKNIYQAEVINE